MFVVGMVFSIHSYRTHWHPIQTGRAPESTENHTAVDVCFSLLHSVCAAKLPLL